MIKEKPEIRNLDGEIIDFTKDDLLEKLTFESANFIRRMISYLVDIIIIIVLWYLFSITLFNEVDLFVEGLGINESDFTNLELFLEFRDMLWELALKIILIFLFVKSAYFTILPAVLGNGQTLGKLVAGIGVVDSKTLEEISPTRLVLREFIYRGFIEGILIIPGIISWFFAFFRKDSRSIHDLLAKTTVIKLDLYDLDQVS